jgi:hypothetical protein
VSGFTKAFIDQVEGRERGKVDWNQIRQLSTQDLIPEPIANVCRWCGKFLQDMRPDAAFCQPACRHAAFRARRRQRVDVLQERQMHVAYADPPYPGKSARFYGDHPDYAGEVSHRELISRLTANYDGWALSTGAYALREVLPLCPPGIKIAAWVKPIGAFPRTYGIHNTWEPVLIMPARKLRPGKRDWLAAQPARGQGDLVGRKPVAFCRWLFKLMGLVAGDTLEDMFPGTGMVTRCWAEFCRSFPKGTVA